jgi:very-short-patch-repair endonuclease
MKELDKRMYFNAKPGTLETARILRKRMTNCEILLWEKLKGKQIQGLRFRSQHPIDIFIVDFYCHEARLVVEIDGQIHEGQIEYDDGREAEIEKYDIKVIRFTNDEVINNIDKVVNNIKTIVKERIKSHHGGPDSHLDDGVH